MYVRDNSSMSTEDNVEGATVGARDGFENKCQSKFRDVSRRVRFHNSRTFGSNPSGLDEVMLSAVCEVVFMNEESSTSKKCAPIFLTYSSSLPLMSSSLSMSSRSGEARAAKIAGSMSVFCAA